MTATKTFRSTIIPILFVLTLTHSAHAGGASQTLMKERLGFNQCIVVMEQMIAEAGVPARRIIPIVNTAVLRVTKLVLDDSNLIITCSKPDQSILVTKSTPPDLHLVR